MSGNEQDKHTLVEEETEFSGRLRAKCRVVVRGSVEGELEAPAVDVTETGAVTGILKSKTLQSHGALKGTIEVDDISVAGQVHSDTVIRAKTLEVKAGGPEGSLEVTFGDCVLEVGEMPGDQPEDDDTATVAETAVEAKEAAVQAKADEKSDDDTETVAEPEAKGDDSDGTASKVDDDAAQRRGKRRKGRRGKGKQAASDTASQDAAAPDTTPDTGDAAPDAKSDVKTDEQPDDAAKTEPSEANGAASPEPAPA